jgi:peptidoglycan/xylan/chitin deacetylase (PgdA/CDA1 family)
MRDSGLITLGGHTHTHPILARCSEAVQQQEIARCQERFVAELGQPARLFAYPNGYPADFDQTTINTLKDAGFSAAFTMEPRALGGADESFRLPRHGSPATTRYLEAVVSGGVDLLRETKTTLKGLWQPGRRSMEAS